MIPFRAAAAVAALLAAAPLAADGGPALDELAACSAVAGADDRLACYDAAALAYGLEQDWNVAVAPWRLDPDGDAALLPAAGGVLVLRCGDGGGDGGGEAAIAWDRPVGNDSRSPFEHWAWVAVRYGNGAAERQRWPLDPDGFSTRAPLPLDAIANRIAASGPLAATVQTDDGTVVSALFDAVALFDAAGELPPGCRPRPFASRG